MNIIFAFTVCLILYIIAKMYFTFYNCKIYEEKLENPEFKKELEKYFKIKKILIKF